MLQRHVDSTQGRQVCAVTICCGITLSRRWLVRNNCPDTIPFLYSTEAKSSRQYWRRFPQQCPLVRVAFGAHVRTSHILPGVTLCQPAIVCWLSWAGRPHTPAVGAPAVGCLGVLRFIDILRSDVLLCLDVLRANVCQLYRSTTFRQATRCAVHKQVYANATLFAAIYLKTYLTV